MNEPGPDNPRPLHFGDANMETTIPLDVLTRPFDPSQVKQREGRGGKMLDYLETHAVITRLNEAFAGAWSFEVVEHHILDNEVFVRGRLTAVGQTKEQFGGTEITRTKDDGKALCLADDLKSAGSDALKKCATLFGVGLELYAKDGPARAEPEASEKQTGFLRALASSPLLSPEEKAKVEAEIQPTLTRQRASDLIDELQATIKDRVQAQRAQKPAPVNGTNGRTHQPAYR